MWTEYQILYLQLEELKNAQGISGGMNSIRGQKGDVTKKNDVPEDPIVVQRREKVKDAMIHAWTSYEKYAWGRDELQV